MHLFFSVNFLIFIFNIPFLTSPANVMKIAGAQFSSGTDVNAFQILISYFQFTYKKTFPRVGGALKFFTIIFAPAILLPVVINKCHILYFKGQINGLTFLHQVFKYNKS